MIFQNAELNNVEELVEDKESGGYRLTRVPRSLISKLNAFHNYITSIEDLSKRNIWLR